MLTIVDNDAGGAFRFSAPATASSETSATANVTVTRSNGGRRNGKVRIRLGRGHRRRPDVDYVAVDQVLTFAAESVEPDGARSRSTVSNTTVDGARTIQLALQSPAPVGLSSLGSPATAT